MIKACVLLLINSTVYSGTFWCLVLINALVRLTVTFVKRHQRSKTFPRRIAARRKECEASFDFDVRPDELPAGLQQQILDSDLLQLRELIWSQKVTSEQAVRFYFHRCKTIGRTLGAAVESNFAHALQLAKRADERIRTCSREELPPLCGLPFSVKENYYMEGFENTHGLPTRLGKKAAHTSLLLLHLVDNGGIPFVRSNIPQLLMAAESDNEIYGRCDNAHNPKRVSGGSSGGEGALIGAGCSPAGLGNDIGGSIRIPALFNGVFGFKPTMDRFNVVLHYPAIHCYFNQYRHQPYIKVSNGPLGKSVADLELLTGLMADTKINFDIDHTVPPLPWNHAATRWQAGHRLRIGYIESLDDVFECSPANRRAVQEVVAALRKDGHELVEVKLPYEWLRPTLKLILQIYITDGSVPENLSLSNGMKMIEAYWMMQLLWYVPQWIKLLALVGQPRLSDMLFAMIPLKAEEIFKKANEQLAAKRFFLQLLRDLRVAHLVSPGLGCPASLHGKSADTLLNFAYTTLFNLFGLPTGVLPVTKVRPDEQRYESKYRDDMTRQAQKCMENSAGLPVGVQVTAFPFRDEECLALMSRIESLMSLKPFIAK